MSFSLIFILFLFQFSNSLTNLEVENQWISYKRSYSLRFRPEEEIKRKLIFRENLRMIEEHNSGDSSWTMGVNQFTHLSNKEVEDMFPVLYDQPVDTRTEEEKIKQKEIERRLMADPTSDDINYVRQGVVSPVADQRNCNSGYAFAAVTSIESNHQMHWGTEGRIYSVQSVIDCSIFFYRNFGCQGGDIINSFDHVYDNGITLDSAYPYAGYVKPCRPTKTFNISVYIPHYLEYEQFNEVLVSSAVFGHGPTATGINLGFQFVRYRGGMFNSTICKKYINHHVVIVGLGSNPKHYIIKNSFGTTWGEKGYMRLLRYNDNMCGIAIRSGVPDYPR